MANEQQSGKGGISKMEAVRRALAEMGQNATPSQLQPFIQQNFGIGMTTDHISTYKGDIRRKAAKGKSGMGKTTASKSGGSKSATGTSQASSARQGQAGGRIGLKDIETVKDLVGRVGADSLRTLINLLGR
jgi:hypothetical protein